MSAYYLLLEERVRQLARGRTVDRDAYLTHGELARFALVRLLAVEYGGQRIGVCDFDLLVKFISPWEQERRDLREHSRIELLTEAGALIVAEIERLLAAGRAPVAQSDGWNLVAMSSVGDLARFISRVGGMDDPIRRLEILDLVNDGLAQLVTLVAAELERVRPLLPGENGHHQPE